MPRICLLSLWFLTACATYQVIDPAPGEDDWRPLSPQPVSTPAVAEDGSLYRRDYMFTLFQDRRAYRIGDILTVTLEEKTQSSKKAGTSLGKTSSFSLPTPTVAGKARPDWANELSASRDFDGSASSSQQNTLTGSITVTVADVLPNGVLRIRGEKWIRLNQGDEYIRLGGMVRVEDIDQWNRLSSQRIADARITYAGRGALADSNQAGWLTRFFNSALAPF